METSKRDKIIKMAQSGEYDVCVFGAGYIGKKLAIKMLSIYDIHIDFYCDNNKMLWGTKIVNEILCISPHELKSKADRIVCFVFVTGIYTDEVINQLNSMGIKNVVSSFELGKKSETRKYFFPFLNEKIAVYTCIVGGYDNLKEPTYISENCDYFLVSDQAPPEGSMYQYIDISKYLPDSGLDNTRKNRYIKLHPHLLFPEYRYSIYIDGSIRLRGDIAECIYRIPQSGIMAMSEAYMDTYSEAIRLMNNGMGEPEIIYKQLEEYYNQGMPIDFGHWFNTILIREHNKKICISMMEQWWEEVKNKSRRDQMSFPYIVWKNGFKPNDIGVVTQNPKVMFMNDCEYFEYDNNHNVDRKQKEFMVEEVLHEEKGCNTEK